MSHLSVVDHLQTIDPPWVQLLVVKRNQIFDVEKGLCEIPEFFVRIIDGIKCKNRHDLFSEFAAMFGFPQYFGYNWAALDECITDLEWAPAKGYILLIKDAEQLLVEDSQEEYTKLVRILKKAGEEWSMRQIDEWPRNPTPFHVLLIVSEDRRRSGRDWEVPAISLDSE